MSSKSIAQSLVVAAIGWAALAGAAQATVLTTIDLTAIEGTSWSNVNNAPVRVDFGAGYGYGTISVSAINGGYHQNYQTPYSGEPQTNLDLGGGNTLNITNESNFWLSHGQAGVTTGVTFTIKLDSGDFDAGTVVTIRSLDRGGFAQYFSPGDEFAAPYAAQLPTDHNFPGAVPMTLIGSDADGDLYGASAPGISMGMAFPLAASTDEFSFRVLSNSVSTGGIAFAIAAPSAHVPEPESLSLMLLGMGLIGFTARRRQKVAAR